MIRAGRSRAHPLRRLRLTCSLSDGARDRNRRSCPTLSVEFGVMLNTLRSARSALEVAARDFDPSACSGAGSDRSGRGDRARSGGLIDGMLAKAAKRVEDTAAYTYEGIDRNAAELCARVTGVSSGEAKRAIEVAAKLESLPATDAAVRAGTLSARATDLIVAAASEDPTVERELIQAAAKGMVPLRDAVIAARARREDEAERAKRQHAARSFRMWPTADGMVEGHFKVTPEVGGAIKAVIEQGHGEAVPRRPQQWSARIPGCVRGRRVRRRRGRRPGSIAKGGGWSAHVRDRPRSRSSAGHALDGETCEIPGVGPVNVEWVRSCSGTAFVTAIIKKGKDITTVAHFGRHIPAELRTAMIVSGRECSIEGCSGREYLELDHCEIDHAKNGPDGVVEPRLALLHPPHPKNPGLDPRPTRPHHRKTKTRPTTTPVTPREPPTSSSPA